MSTPNTWGPGLESLSDAALAETNRHWTLARALSDVAHAINNTLQVMSGSAELLEQRLADDPAVRQRLQAIRLQAERAASTVNDLLAYAGGGEAGRRATDLNRLVDIALAMRAHSLSRLRILAPRGAPSGERAMAVVDANRCLQLMLNALLLLESRLIGRDRASIATACTVSVATASLRLQGGGSGWEGDPWGGTDRAALGQQWRVIQMLAASMEGTAALVEVDGAPGVELMFAAAPPTCA